MNRLSFLLIILVISNPCKGQPRDLKKHLYTLENRIIAGDIQALKEMVPYLDNKTFVQEFLGYHNYPSSARMIAIRVLKESCLFQENEFVFDTAVTAGKFLAFFNANNVKFDVLTGRFLITDATHRTTKYELKKLSPGELRQIDAGLIKFPFPDWYYENQIDWFLKNKDNQALLWIASAWYNKRARFNRYYYADDEFLNLAKHLTHIDLSVPNQRGQMDFLYKDDYYADSKLNYLVYWANHYKDYQWNDNLGYFVNTKEQPGAKSSEEELFTLLTGKNDSLAIDAFTKLSEMDTARVTKLADQYQVIELDGNDALPSFAFRFLKQMVVFTFYSRNNGFYYKPSGWLLDSLILLKKQMTFSNRYRLENNIVAQLSLEQATMVEYFGLINEHTWNATYSIGRILDKFYSNKWSELTSNRNQLAFFLKKSKLFDELGIIGICNKYLLKFKNCSATVLASVADLSTSSIDPDIRAQASKVISLYSKPVPAPASVFKESEGHNRYYGVENLTNKYNSLRLHPSKNDEINFSKKQLLSKISYGQIGIAIKLVENDTAWKENGKYDFIERDFGLEIDLDSSSEISDFLKRYNSTTEYEMYVFYARQSGTSCINTNGELDYAAVHDLLKYGIVDAFVGGGGSRREHGVYPVIKLLEFKFNSTLGFPRKKCSSQGIYGCDCTDQAEAWMQFLEGKKLIDKDKPEPASISANQ